MLPIHNNPKFKIMLKQNSFITNNNYEFIKTECIVNNKNTLILIVKYICPIYNFNPQKNCIQKTRGNTVQKYYELQKQPNNKTRKPIIYISKKFGKFMFPKFKQIDNNDVSRYIRMILNKGNNNNNPLFNST
jgi:hypothetical protein